MASSNTVSTLRTLPAERSRSGAGAVLLAMVVNVVASTLIAWLIGRLAIAFGVPSSTVQYRLATLAVIILLASVVGAVGWTIVRRRAANPRGLIRILAPVVVVVSLVPDVLLGVGGVASWPTVVGLMVMHVAVAAITVTTFTRLLPLPRAHA